MPASYLEAHVSLPDWLRRAAGHVALPPEPERSCWLYFVLGGCVASLAWLVVLVGLGVIE